jgi:superfamily II DNA or RNA helicase
MKRGEDVLIESPTGSGKTPMIARLAATESRAGGRVLVLTHRKLLFGQMVGRKDADSEKKRQGELMFWGGEKPGTIADETLGGVDQSSSVVVGMVESVASRLDLLEDYTRVIIDETQHVSDNSSKKSEKRDVLGAYAQVLEALPDARLVGLTATTFRGDGDKLHPRLEKAHREVVAIEEARDARRIVPAKTVIGKARTESGYTAEELCQMEAEGRLDKSASAVLSQDRGDRYYNHVVEDWDKVAKRSKTIVFVDSVEEVRDMTRRFNERYGEGVAVCLHGGKNTDGKTRSSKQNAEALNQYDTGPAQILIACQMIGEGFDVPDTDTVMSLNSSLSRLQMNQFVGRCVRSAHNKLFGLFVDYGTASHEYGFIEHQHEMQNVDALSAAGTKIAASRVIGRMAPVRDDKWSAVPGKDESFFLKRTNGRYRVYHLDHKAEKADGRRASKNSSSVTKLSKYEHPVFGTRALKTKDVAEMLALHARKEAPFFARIGGVGSEDYKAASAQLLDHWGDERKKIDDVDAEYETPGDAEIARKEALDQSIAGGSAGTVKGRMLKKALNESKNGVDMVRACLDLSEDILSKCADHPDIPFGIASEAREVAECLSAENVREMKPMAMRKEAMATSSVLEHFRKNIANEDLATAIGNVSEPLQSGVIRLTRDIVKAQRRKKEKSK